MKTLALLCAALALTGCVSSERMALGRQCRAEAGRQPYAAAGMFGLVGALVAQSQTETKEWNKRVDDCMHERTLNASR